MGRKTTSGKGRKLESLLHLPQSDLRTILNTSPMSRDHLLRRTTISRRNCQPQKSSQRVLRPAQYMLEKKRVYICKQSKMVVKRRQPERPPISISPQVAPPSFSTSIPVPLPHVTTTVTDSTPHILVTTQIPVTVSVSASRPPPPVIIVVPHDHTSYNAQFHIFGFHNKFTEGLKRSVFSAHSVDFDRDAAI